MKVIRGSSLLFALAALVTREPDRSWASSVTWTNASGGSWNTPANWSPQQVPGASDTALITAAGTYSVTQDVNVTVAGVILGGDTGAQTLLNNSYTLTLSGPGTLGTNATLALGGGTLSGSGVLEVQGVLSWSAGSVGRLSVLTNGLLFLSGTGSKSLHGAVTNWGTVRVTGASDWSFYDWNTWLVNEASGVVDVQNDRALSYNNYGGYLLNRGTFRKSAGAGVTTVNLPFSNTGLVEVQTGTVRFSSGGTVGGTYDVAGGAVLELSGGSFSVSGVPVFGGAGVSRFTGGTLTLPTDIIANLAMVGGTLVLGPGFQDGGSITNLTLNGPWLSGAYGVSGQLEWVGGTVGGALTVATNGLLLLSGTGSKSLHGAVTNWGTVRVTGASDWSFYDWNTWLVNEASGVVDVQNDRALSYNNYGGYLLNRGTFRKSAGAGVTTVNLPFSNTGLVEVQTGTVRFSSGGTVGGTYDVAGGAVLELSGGSFSVSGVPVFGGAVVSRFTGGTLTLPTDIIANLAMVGGTLVLGPGFQDGGSITNLTLNGPWLSGAYGVSGQLEWVGGTVGGPLTVATNGLLLLSGTGSKSLHGAVTNWGTVRVTGASDWSFYDWNTWLVNEASGVVDVQNDRALSYNNYGGYLLNRGTFRKSAGAGVTTVNLPFSNTGLVEVQTGTVRFSSGGTVGGTYDVAGGAVLELSGGSFSVSGVPVFGGAVVSRFTGGTLTLPTDIIANLAMVGGTLVLGPGFQDGGSITNLTLNGPWLSGAYGVSGQLEWVGGTVGGPLTVATNGLLLLSGTGSKSLRGAVTNWGTVRVTGASDWSFYDWNTWLVNEASGVVDVQNDRALSYNNYGGYLLNRGTFRKSAGAGVTTVNLPFSNTGLVEVQTGTVRFSSTYAQTGGTLSFRLNSLSDFGRIATSQTLQLTGALAITFGGGYLPALGQYYDIISAPIQGVFQTYTAPPLSTNLFIVPSYRANGVQLVTTNATPSLSKPVVDAQRHFTMEIRGIVGQLYVVEASTNFVVWTPVATNAMPASMIWLFVDQDSLTFPYRYYRVRFDPQTATPAGPYLTITRSNNVVVVTWPLPATGWLLHARTNLVAGGSLWTEIPPPYQTNGPNLQFAEPMPRGNKFYRLHQP